MNNNGQMDDIVKNNISEEISKKYQIESFIVDKNYEENIIDREENIDIENKQTSPFEINELIEKLNIEYQQQKKINIIYNEDGDCSSLCSSFMSSEYDSDFAGYLDWSCNVNYNSLVEDEQEIIKFVDNVEEKSIISSMINNGYFSSIARSYSSSVEVMHVINSDEMLDIEDDDLYILIE